MRIVYGLEGVDKEHLIEMYNDAFASKYITLLENNDTVIRVLRRAYNIDSGIAMLSEDNQLMGVLSYKEEGKIMFDLSFSSFVKELGWVIGLQKLLMFWLIFDRKTRKDELYVDRIVVSPEYRSMGVGKQLLDEMEIYASSKGYQYIGLDVIDENPRALSLYEKIGFVVSMHQKTPKWVSSRIGVTGVSSMLKRIGNSSS